MQIKMVQIVENVQNYPPTNSNKIAIKQICTFYISPHCSRKKSPLHFLLSNCCCTFAAWNDLAACKPRRQPSTTTELIDSPFGCDKKVLKGNLAS